MDKFLFYAFAALALCGAIGVVSLRNTARALFLFFIVLFAVAGLYLFALADFVAITQILIYVGGVLILMIFAFMLSNKALLEDMHVISGRFMQMPSIQSLLLTFGFLGVMGYGLWEWVHMEYQPYWMERNLKQNLAVGATDNNIASLGFLFMTRYVLAFEVMSIFLLMTLIGAAHIARKEEEK